MTREELSEHITEAAFNTLGQVSLKAFKEAVSINQRLIDMACTYLEEIQKQKGEGEASSVLPRLCKYMTVSILIDMSNLILEEETRMVSEVAGTMGEFFSEIREDKIRLN